MWRLWLWFKMFRSAQDPYSHQGKHKTQQDGGRGRRRRPSQLARTSACWSLNIPLGCGAHWAVPPAFGFLSLCETSQYKPPQEAQGQGLSWKASKWSLSLPHLAVLTW